MIKAVVNVLAPMLLFAAAPAMAQSAEELTGIWRADVTFGPKLQGPLVVRKSSAGYTATIGGEPATSGARGGIRFAFGRDGSFRGSLRGRTLEGFWIQPSSDMQSLGEPGGTGSAYATPVHLEQVSAGVWRGNVRPLTSRFTFWLSIFRADDGALTGAFRNPQLNSTGGAPRFKVSRSGDAITFSAKAG